MSEILATVLIETANGPVRINETDFDAETMKLFESESIPSTPVMPSVTETQTTVVISETPVKKFVTKKGKGFVVVDAAGNKLDETVFETEELAWASTFQI